MLTIMILVAIVVMAAFGIALLLMMASVARDLVDAIKGISFANEEVVNKPMDKVTFVYPPNEKRYFHKKGNKRKDNHFIGTKNHNKEW
jgi:hypothetical protein